MLGTAGSLPVFAASGGTAGVILMAASQIVKVGSELAEALIDGTPCLACSHEIRFDTFGLPETAARILVLANYRDRNEFTSYRTGLDGGGTRNGRIVLKHRETGEVYGGDAPYVIVSLDGRKRQELDGYSAQALSSAMLERFYGGDDMGGVVVTSLQKGLELYNDLKYRDEAVKLRRRLAEMPDGEEKERGKTRLAACLENIRTQELRPAE